MAKFSEVFEDVTKQGRKLQTTEYQKNGKYVIIDQGQNEVAGYTDETEGVFENIPAIVFGDHTRVIKYVDKPCFLGADGVKLLRAKIGDANYRYLFYALSHVELPNTGYNRHFKWLKEIDINLPDAITQNKVLTVLDKISHLITKRRTQLDKLDELAKSRFIELFGDPVINPFELPIILLSETSDIVSGITKGRRTNGAELQEVPYMAVPNVKAGYIDWSTIKTIDATQSEIDQYRLQPFDVLMTEGGDPDKLGRGAIISNPPENCIHQNHIFRVRVDRCVLLPQYLEEYLQHQKAKQYFFGCAKQTTGIASINMKQLRALPVLLPKMELQEQFAAFVEQSDKSKLAVQQGLDKLETLKKALMQKYFG